MHNQFEMEIALLITNSSETLAIQYGFGINIDKFCVSRKYAS